MTDLTPRQADVLRYLKEHIEQHGTPPSLREIGAIFGWRHQRSVQHLNALQQKGYLVRGSGPREIRLLSHRRTRYPAPWVPVRTIEGRLCALVWGLAP